MKKTIFITIAMAAVLFVYGYFLSNEGHDHSDHQHAAQGQEQSSDSSEDGHLEHAHE